MTAPTMRRDGEIFMIDFGDHENRTDPEWITTMGALLDEAEAADGPKALITTGSGKHYSNGLDVDFMSSASSAETTDYVHGVQNTLARLLTFPAPTVAAINGHAFGAGAFLVLAHDQTVMRDDRGFICWPEVHLGMPFTGGLMAMIQNLMTNRTAQQAAIMGPRYSAEMAVAADLVDRTASLDELVATAMEMVAPLTQTAGANLGGIKAQMYAATVAALTGGD